eukprot:11185963-Lingulodinium_polyedra.AAC.1
MAPLPHGRGREGVPERCRAARVGRPRRCDVRGRGTALRRRGQPLAEPGIATGASPTGSRGRGARGRPASPTHAGRSRP